MTDLLHRIGFWFAAVFRRLFFWRRPSHAGQGKAAARRPNALGRFELGSQVAVGGHGRIWRASRYGGPERFIVKTARDATGSLIAQEALAHEAEVLSLLDGRGVPTFHQTGIDPWFGRYLIMDLVEGGQLGLFRPHADAKRWLRLMRRLSARVARLHQQGVAHNDLRLENVLVDGNDRPWLIDFAAARLALTADPAAATRFAEACGRDVAVLRQWILDTPSRNLSARQRKRLAKLNNDPRFVSATAAEVTAQLNRIEQGRLLRGERRLMIRRRLIMATGLGLVFAGLVFSAWWWTR